MKSILIALLLTTISFAQTDIKSKYKVFYNEFEAYRNNPEVASENSTIKPAPCGQYNLKFMVTGTGEKELVNVPKARKLCFDLNRFDRTKNKELSEDWEYEIKPIGDRFYSIRTSKKGVEGTQEIYYYERKK
jgi:hypothetical protein